jgi:DNA-binding transcriptional ArsR family regulator
MTAGEIAAATGLGRATVSTTLSKLATSGEIAKAARGYQLGRESDTTRKPARPRPSASTVATSPSRPAAEPPAAEPTAVEPQAAEPPAAEPLAGESPAVGPARSAARSAPGAARHAVLAAFARGSAMTADEVATATGLGRASVSSTLSQLAEAGELRNAARGYQLASVGAAQRFYFQIEDATPRAVVANLPELEAAIAVCGPEVLRHHCAERDLSRWVAGVLHNEPLAADIAAAEARLSADSPTEAVDYVRLGLIAALQARHATQR